MRLEKLFSTPVSRRGFLKAAIPFGWLPEAIRGDELSTPAKLSLVKDGAILAIFAGINCSSTNRDNTTENSKESKTEKSLKEKILSFGWKDVENKERINAFVDALADAYLQLTQTPRLKKEDLVGQDKTNFYQSRERFVNAIRTVDPTFSPSENQWGYTDYKSKRVFIDIDRLKKQAISQTSSAGLPLLDALWHEWGHLDVVERTSGELIDNPQAYFYSPNSKRNEAFKRYRGGTVYTESYYGFIRFDEVWNETITLRRMIEQLGLEEVISGGDYYENGVDFFPKFTLAANIPLEVMYSMHAASDFEGFARFVGLNLPGNGDALEKGIKLFIGIHQSNTELIRQTGVFERMPNN